MITKKSVLSTIVSIVFLCVSCVSLKKTNPKGLSLSIVDDLKVSCLKTTQYIECEKCEGKSCIQSCKVATKLCELKRKVLVDIVGLLEK